MLEYEYFKSESLDEILTYGAVSSVSMSFGIFAFLQVGDLQRSYIEAQKSKEIFPEHVDSQQLINQLKQHFARL